MVKSNKSETKKRKRTKGNEIRKKTDLNTRHENIKFNFEKEKDNKLLFLDTVINNIESDLQTSVFHKKTYWVTVKLFQFCA